MMQKLMSILAILGILVMFILLAVTAGAGEPTRPIPITGTEHNMVAYGQVAMDGLDFSSAKQFLLSFGPGGDQDCRSRSEIGQDGSFYATIVGNQEGETITFKVETENGQVYDLTTSILFHADATLEKLTLR